MSKLVIATTNVGKIKEFKVLFQGTTFEIIPQDCLDVPDVPETGLTFIENAILKARNATKYTGLPALADDSGIEVDALAGKPGVYSARFAGEHGNMPANRQKLLRLMKDVPEEKRTARFQCVLALLRFELDPSPIVCQGTWEGSILHEERGTQGFGYDALFYDPIRKCSAAELAPEIKTKVSHRAVAFRALSLALKTFLINQ